MELYCPEFNLSALHLRVVVPHFFQEGASECSGGYGSGRSGNRLPRSLALARCLGSVLSLNRSSHDWMINIAELQLERTGDLGERNAGMLIFFDGRQRPEYVPWPDVEQVDFDRPPAMYQPSGLR